MINQLNTYSCSKLGSQSSNALIDELRALIRINGKFIEMIIIMFRMLELIYNFQFFKNRFSVTDTS